MTCKKILKKQDRRNFLKFGTCTGIGLIFSGIELSCSPKQPERKEEDSIGDEFIMMAYCSIKCDECDAYIATKNDDNELRDKVAERWKMKPENINCEGCKSQNSLFNCSARKCARDRNVITCAHCEDFPACDNEIWKNQPKLKKNVENIQEKLKT